MDKIYHIYVYKIYIIESQHIHKNVHVQSNVTNRLLQKSEVQAQDSILWLIHLSALLVWRNANV